MKNCVITIVLAAMPACAISDDTTGGGTESASADNGDCSPGTEACECIEGGLCVEGLVCASDVCVSIDPAQDDDGGGETGGPKPPDDTGAADETGGDDGDGPVGSCEGNCGGSAPDGDGHCFCTPSCEFAGDCCADYEDACAGDCIFSSQCGDDEVCAASAGTCVPAYEHTYEVAVTRWEDHTPDCWDAGDCYADVKFKAYYGSQGQVYESVVRDDTAVATWEDSPFELSINATDALQFVFFDSDLANDDTTNGVCFPSAGVCGPVTVGYLHDGGATWDMRADADPSKRFYVEVSFTAK